MCKGRKLISPNGQFDKDKRRTYAGGGEEQILVFDALPLSLGSPDPGSVARDESEGVGLHVRGLRVGRSCLRCSLPL